MPIAAFAGCNPIHKGRVTEQIHQQYQPRKKCQRVRYKVWLEIERFDEDTQDGVDMDAPGSALADVRYLSRGVQLRSITRACDGDFSLAEGPALVLEKGRYQAQCAKPTDPVKNSWVRHFPRCCLRQ